MGQGTGSGKMTAEKDRLKQIQDALTAKGIQPGDYDQVRPILNEMKSLQDRIAEEDGEQFYDDAFKATAGMGLSREMIMRVARYLAVFADRIAQQTIDAQKQNNAPIVADDNPGKNK